MQDDISSVRDFHPAFYEARIMADYTRELFQYLVKVRKGIFKKDQVGAPPIPRTLSFELITDSYHIASLACDAYCNVRESRSDPGDWKVIAEALAQGGCRGHSANMQQQCPRS